jgi:hypothetical protein
MKRRAEPSLQALATHLSALTDSHWHTSLPMALAEATKGAAEWEGLDLLRLCCLDLLVALLTFKLRLHSRFSVLITAQPTGANLNCYDRSCPSRQTRTLSGY